MDTVIEILNGLGLIVPVLLIVGAGWKWLPIVRNWTNEVIPLLNALVAFLVAFGGGAGAAHAGVFGWIGHTLSIPGQVAASALLAWFSGWVHDKFLKGLTPPSPYRAAQGK